MAQASRSTGSRRSVALALALDVVLVIAFAAIGRASHQEGAFGLGLLQTVWPFLVGLVIGWVIARAWRHPAAMLTGVVVWAFTVGLGLALRVGTGDTAELPFIIVATATLALFLLGWRLIAALITRRGTTESDR